MSTNYDGADWSGYALTQHSTRGQNIAPVISHISAHLRALLLIPTDEPLPPAQNYFDLGITSLQIEELHQHLEAVLNCEITTMAFFDHPTIQGLAEHIAAHLSVGNANSGKESSSDKRTATDPECRSAQAEAPLETTNLRGLLDRALEMESNRD